MIAIVLSEFNQEVTNGLLNGCLASLKTGGFNDENVDVHKVPGAFELPAKVKFLASSEKKDYKAIIALGCVIKGETDHYHYISQAVTNGIMALTLDLNKKDTKIIFGVLTCQNKGLALARSSTDMQKNKGYEAGLAAIEQITTPSSK